MIVCLRMSAQDLVFARSVTVSRVILIRIWYAKAILLKSDFKPGSCTINMRDDSFLPIRQHLSEYKIEACWITRGDSMLVVARAKKTRSRPE